MLLKSIIIFIITTIFMVHSLFDAYGDPIKNYYKITRKYFPVYRELISKYNAKYPCVMDYIGLWESASHNLKGISNLNSFIFIKDRSFVITSSIDSDIYVEIPFKSIIYHHSYVSGTYGKEYCFRITLFFKTYNSIESFSFYTLDYEHTIDKRINKKYPDLLNDEKLFDFVCENFPNEEEYRRKRDLERSNISFETSIFHKFTRIDAE